MPLKGDDAKPDDRTRLLHMLEAARQALTFIAGRNRIELDTDHMLRRAVKDCIQEIGEAALHVTDEVRERLPGLPWNKIVGMRHILVHAYYDLENDAIWKVATQDLAVLATEIEKVLGQWPGKSDPSA
jgi:uncharacterized protein with HEPN domain